MTFLLRTILPLALSGALIDGVSAQSYIITTVAGTTRLLDGKPANTVPLKYPHGVAQDASGNLYIADALDHRVRKVGPDGTISTIAGTGTAGYGLIRAVSAEGIVSYLLGSSTGSPQGMIRDGASFYFADATNHRIYKSFRGAVPNEIAGNGSSGFSGDNGVATLARLNAPRAVALDPTTGNLYIADTGNCRIRMVTNRGIISTLAGNGTCGATGDDGPVADAQVAPFDVAFASGNLYFADRANHRVRKIDLATNIISSVAGTGTGGFSGDGGPAKQAQLRNPTGIALDAAGNLYIADNGNSRVRVVRGTTISTLAGTGSFRFDAESGPATSVSLDPLRLAIAPDGGIYIADNFNDRIRRLAVAIAATMTISAGDGQSGAPGTQIRIAVKIANTSGAALSGVTVNFSVLSGSAQLSASSAQTGADGVAAVTATLGQTVGPVRISASSAGISGVTFNLSVTAPTPTPAGPAIDDGGVTGAALSIPAVRALSSGGIASVFGKNFGAGAAFQKVGPGDLVNGKVPTNFKGICVDVGGALAPVFGASDTQVNFQAPALTPGGNVAVRVVANCGTANEQRSNSVSVAAQAASPEFFYFASNADGRNPVAATDSITGAYIAPATLFPGSGFAETRPGKYVTAYATGFGGTNPPVAAGDFPDALAAATGPVRVFLGGRELPAANVLYAGITPGSPGLYQLNLQIPADAPDGNASLVIQIGSVRSPEGAFLAIRNSTDAPARLSDNPEKDAVLLRQFRGAPAGTAEDVLGEAIRKRAARLSR